MGIGSHLLNKENLSFVKKSSWSKARPKVIEEGLRYYEAHPEDVELIASNLARVGLPSGGAFLDEVLEHMAAHYYEKLFVLVKTYEAYWIALNRIEMAPEALAPFERARAENKAVFVAQSHFGASYLLHFALMARGFDVTVVGNFPDPVRPMILSNAEAIAAKWPAGGLTMLHVYDEGVDVPMEMMRGLMTRKIVSNVFDENNALCRPQKILGAKVMGGTGMDLILRRFSDENVIAVTPFLVRTSHETFRYELDRHSLSGGDIIASFYRSLEKRVEKHPAQWYFIHEVHESFLDT